jgi:DNA polymerase-3 subunit epsilon
MNTKIFYDTETTGLPLFNDPSDDPRQPHMVQLAAIMVDMDTRLTIQSMDVIIRPDGWVITPENTAIHGITHEHAMDIGVNESVGMAMLLDLVGHRTRIGHNETFDARIVRIALKRYINDQIADLWKAGLSECTAGMTTKICDLPPTPKMIAAKRNHAKTPNLQEAYTHFFGKAFESAHSAMADVTACRDVYFAVQDYNAKLAA